MSVSSPIIPTQLVDKIERSVREAVEHGVIWKTADAVEYLGRHVSIGGESLLNFGGCSYLGLEQRSELKEAAIAAIRTYGTQFSYSRAYLQSPLYQRLELLLAELTGGYPLVTASTSLGHISALPAIVRPSDGVVIDLAAHASVHTAAGLIRGAEVARARHNHVGDVVRQVERLSRTHERVWYLLDGLYSMLGDFAPMEELAELLVRFPQLHLYVDDAHSTSWCGKHGRGFALDSLPDTSRVLVALSLNKAFSAAGGALVFPTPELRDRVRMCGGPMVFSGPVQPPMLGAAVAAAELHLDGAFASLQQRLMEKIDLTLALCRERGVVLSSYDRTPIFFVHCGAARRAFQVAERLRSSGIYACVSVFPAVAENAAGIRFTISVHNEAEDIARFVDALAAEVQMAA
jgi:7-keto-8-aminopelargonate synthetase-like enzyme